MSKPARLALTIILSATCGLTIAANYSRLNVGQALFPGDTLTGDDYVLTLQASDGNVVMYNRAGKAVWATNKRGNSFVMQADGNLVQYDGTGFPVWNSQSGVATFRDYYARISPWGSLYVGYQVDGSSSWREHWVGPKDPNSSSSSDKCPDGSSQVLYPACVFPGTTFQFTTPIPACSYADAINYAYLNGYRPGVCR